MMFRMNAAIFASVKWKTSNLPARLEGSLHYQTLCRQNVQSNFRYLAVFTDEIESGYLMLLETVFMAILGTYQFHGRTNIDVSPSSYDLVAQIRAEVGLPQVSWLGINAAIPMMQGFTRRTNKTSACCNADCETLTAPVYQRVR